MPPPVPEVESQVIRNNATVVLARLRLLGLLAERDISASVSNDFADIEK
jgi:hypothetical protein